MPFFRSVSSSFSCAGTVLVAGMAWKPPAGRGHFGSGRSPRLAQSSAYSSYSASYCSYLASKSLPLFFSHLRLQGRGGTRREWARQRQAVCGDGSLPVVNLVHADVLDPESVVTWTMPLPRPLPLTPELFDLLRRGQIKASPPLVFA